MKSLRIPLMVLFLGFFSTLALTEDDISISTGIIGGGKLLGAKTYDNNTTVGIIGIDSSGNTTVKSLSGKKVDFPGEVSATGDIAFSATGQPKYAAVTVITPAVTPLTTPVASNVLSSRFSMVVTAAPTSAFPALPAATANVGETHALWNAGANPVQIMPGAGDTINALAALTPYACATGKLCECKGFTTAISMCDSR